ncbi:hypothetical protein Fcan01_26939 [Folsomia candida]|uniref:Uncharacterized protein n=1 Tax=Folsomia candida TaxID=158441 RepID=A0A226CYB5_FOLCA|nr:hypothetical protein Fcan01_26939 [Folsomia candida]
MVQTTPLRQKQQQLVLLGQNIRQAAYAILKPSLDNNSADLGICSQLFEAISVAVIRRGWGIVYRNKLKMAVFGQRKVQIPSSTCPMKTINCGVDLNGTPITTTPSSPQKLGQPYAVVP